MKPSKRAVRGAVLLEHYWSHHSVTSNDYSPLKVPLRGRGCNLTIVDLLAHSLTAWCQACVWIAMIYITSRWQLISVYRLHNSTVSRRLRYSLTRESMPQPVSRDKAPCAVAEWKYKYEKRKIMMTKNCRYATINSKHYISVSGTT